MIEGFNRASWVVRMGLLAGAMMLLMLLAMTAHFLHLRDHEIDAVAVNVAVSLHRHFHRLLDRLSDDPDAALPPVHALAEMRELEHLLDSPRLAAAIPADPASELRRRYERVQALWQGEIRPLLLAQAPPQGPPAESYPDRINVFMMALDGLVSAIREQTESDDAGLHLLMGTVLLLSLILMGLLLYQVHKHWVAPLRELTAAAEQIRQGDFTVHTSYTGNDELGLLGRTFNRMAEELNRMCDELESRVEERTQALQASNRCLELLYDTVKHLGGFPLEDSTLQSLLQDIERLTGLGPCHLCLYPNDSSPARLVRAGEHTTLSALTEPNYQSAGPACWLGDDMLSVPVGNHTRQLGALLMGAPAASIAVEQIELLEVVARHVAAALILNRQIEHDRLNALVEERSVIARELHDSLAQDLSFSKIQVSRLQALLASGAPPEQAGEILAELRTGLNEAYRQLRELLTTFRLRMDRTDLEGVLRDLAKEFSQYLTIDLEYGLRGCPLRPGEEIHLLQIVREALVNAVRHAQARRAAVILTREPSGRVRVKVADDGVGLPDEPERAYHFGISIMRERTAGLGGELHLGNQPQGGACMELAFMPGMQQARHADGSSL